MILILLVVEFQYFFHISYEIYQIRFSNVDWCLLKYHSKIRLDRQLLKCLIVTKRDFLEDGSIAMTKLEIPKSKMEVLLKVGRLSYAVGKQTSIPLINLGKNGWWWWWSVPAFFQIRSQLRSAEDQIITRSKASEVRWSADKRQQSTTGMCVWAVKKMSIVLKVIYRLLGYLMNYQREGHAWVPEYINCCPQV